NGHRISGFVAEDGAGLFGVNAGTIRNLAVTDAAIGDGPRRSGILADVNTGTIESSWTSGWISGSSRVGGIAGDSTGVIRDSYSLARVLSRATESGGVVGVARAGSTTERVYATGGVASVRNNAGGLVGYGYAGTTIQDSLALTPGVQAGNQSAHGILGRNSGTPTLSNNYADDVMEVGPVSYPGEPAADNPKGAPVSEEEHSSQAFYAETLGWDFEQTWQWDEG